MTRFGLQFKIILFLVTLFIIALANTSFVYLLESYNTEKAHLISRSHQAILTAKTFLSSMKDAETGQRGYLLTHDPAYLEPYHQGTANARHALKELFTFMKDQPEQLKKLKKIENLMEQKFQELTLTIQLLNKGKPEESLKVVKNDEGKYLMDQIRTLFNELLAQESQHLQKEQELYHIQQIQLKTVMFAMMFLFAFVSILALLFLKKNLFQPFNILLKTAHKTEIGQKATIQDIVSKDEMGYLISSLYRMNDIVIERTQALSFKALHDELTQLKNRPAFETELPKAIQTADQNQSLMALGFLDLNKFKPINDEKGHDYGDLVLTETAKKLKKITRNDDIYRMGGDEFIILLQKVHAPNEAEAFAKRVIKEFQTPIILQDQPLTISVSLGIALYPTDAQDTEQLIKHADTAMYQAKKQSHADGKSHYCFYQPQMAEPTKDAT